MTAFSPAITRSREIIANKTAEVALKLVPDVSEQSQENRKYFPSLYLSWGSLH